MTYRLNILLIVSDDQGTRDAACYGAHDVLTPNLDRLAAEGILFTDFYANAPVCMPSRAALMTGRDFPRGVVPGHGLRVEEITIAEMLRAAGYRTALFGKWHLGYTPATSPNAQGFDEYLGHDTGNLDLYSHFFYEEGVNRHVLQHNGEPFYAPGTYLPDLLVDRALDFIDADADRPFFLYMPFELPHYPLQPRPEIYAEYQKRLPDDPRRALFAACLTSMDGDVGRLLDHLDARGLADDTLVIFLSDNGHSVEEASFGGGGYPGPFRGAKQTLWEGGIRVPCLARCPGRIPAGQVRQQPAIAMDWVPTMVAMAGADLPHDRPIDGRDLQPVLASASAPAPHEALHWASYDGTVAVREGPWKMVSGRAMEPWLSNLAADPGERDNLAAAEPERLQHMMRSSNAWLREVTAHSWDTHTRPQTAPAKRDAD